MNRLWSILFAATAVALVVTIVVSARGPWWFPPLADSEGVVYDRLFYLFLAITGFAFVGTQVLLAVCLWRFGQRPGRKATYAAGSLKLEAAWTLIPTVILAALAIYQMETWAAWKINRPDTAPLAEVTGRRFQWDIRYPGPDGHLRTDDDLLAYDGTLHVPLGEQVVLSVRSDDVIHSFFVPALRLKQDVVPGIEQSVWFVPDKAGEYDIICAELCGWGHSTMRGRLIVESPEDYVAYLDQLTESQDESTSNQ